MFMHTHSIEFHWYIVHDIRVGDRQRVSCTITLQRLCLSEFNEQW